MTGVFKSRDGWLRRFHAAGDPTARLVCLPHAGGAATYYRSLSGLLSSTMEVFLVQYPGRQDRFVEPLISSTETLADRVFDALTDWHDLPLTIFGHSMGATVGFEVARRLQRAGRPPLGLFVSGRQAPSRPHEERVHQGTDDELLAHVRMLSGTDSDVLGDDDLMRAALPSIRSDYRAAETYRYRPGPPLTCPVVTLVGDRDPQVSLADAQVWQGHTEAAYELHVFDGDHFYLAAHTGAVATVITAHVAKWAVE